MRKKHFFFIENFLDLFNSGNAQTYTGHLRPHQYTQPAPLKASLASLQASPDEDGQPPHQEFSATCTHQFYICFPTTPSAQAPGS